MAERLTESEVSKSFTEQELRAGQQARIYQKLGKLEDILEKYGIESMEELKTKLDITNESIKKAQQKLAEIYIQDRDTWKRACELACEEIDCECMYGVNKENYSQYFYQQAKKERNDE